MQNLEKLLKLLDQIEEAVQDIRSEIQGVAAAEEQGGPVEERAEDSQPVCSQLLKSNAASDNLVVGASNRRACKPSLEDVQAAVAGKFGIDIADLASSKRGGNLAQARQIAMFLCREMTDAGYLHIARAFGKKEHTKIIRAVRLVEEQLRNGVEIKGIGKVQQVVEDLKERLNTEQ